MMHRTGPETDLPAHKDHSAGAEALYNSVSSIQAPSSLESFLCTNLCPSLRPLEMTPLVPRTWLEAQIQAKGTTAFEHVLQAGGVLSALGEFTTPSPFKNSLPWLLPLPEVQAKAPGFSHTREGSSMQFSGLCWESSHGSPWTSWFCHGPFLPFGVRAGSGTPCPCCTEGFWRL